MARQKKKRKFKEIDKEIGLEVAQSNNFASKYFRLTNKDSTTILFRSLDRNIVIPVAGRDAIKQEVYDYMAQRPKDPSYDIADSAVASIARKATHNFPLLKKRPSLIALYDDEETIAYHRIPFALDPDLPTPLFDEIMSRTTNSKAFMLWIGSLFFDKSDRSQYCYLHGEGRNGKGVLAKILEQTFGCTFKSEHIPDKRNRFWSSGLIGKRIISFPESESFQSDFPSSGFFKSMTGGDQIRVERKGMDSYSEYFDCKFIFFSNHRPQLKDSVADMRRAIPCEMGPVTDPEDLTYESRIWKEAAGIMGKCFEMYKELSIADQKVLIPTDDQAMLAVTEDSRDRMDAIFDSLLQWTGDHAVNKLKNEHDYILGKDLYSALLDSRLLKTQSEMSEFKTYLLKKYNCKKKMLRLKNGIKTNAYVGLRLKVIGNQESNQVCRKTSDSECIAIQTAFGAKDLVL